MSAVDFRKRRPGALEIPAHREDLVDVGQTMQTMQTMQSNSAFDMMTFDAPPMSAPGGMANRNFEQNFKQTQLHYQHQPYPYHQDVQMTSDDVHEDTFTNLMRSRNTMNFPPPRDQYVAPVSAREPRQHHHVKLEPTFTPREHQQSLPTSPSEAKSRILELGSPLSSPRCNENYKEQAAKYRQRRILIRAVKLKRATAAQLSDKSLETLSEWIADRDLISHQAEPVDKKTAAAMRNRENAARARQTTKENLERLKKQNDSLRVEVTDLKKENERLKHQMEELSALLDQTSFGN